MLEELTKNPKISDFLSLYPKSDWKSCLCSVLIIGISTLESTFKKFIPVEELEFLSESTPLPLRLQIPDLKQTIHSMKEAIDKINSSIENDDSKIQKSLSRNIPRPKKVPPNPILVESTPRFKVLDDAFSKQKWKKENSMPLIKEEHQKQSSSKSRPKSSIKSSSLTKRNVKPSPTPELKKPDPRHLRLPAEGGFTERNFTGSPTLEELLSNSRFTVKEEGRSVRGEHLLANSELKQSFESSLIKKNVKDSNLAVKKSSAVSIAEGFLRNPLIYQLGFKKEEGNMTGRSCSPISNLDTT